MDNFLQPLILALATSEGAGGLFDFNATLPAMALQFILLTIVLTFVFYKPVSKLLEERETFINTNLSEASTKLLKADELYKQYEEQLKEAKKDAQSIISTAESEAKEIVAQDAQRQIDLGKQRAAEDEAVRTGKLKKVLIRSDGTPGSTEIGLHKSSNGTEDITTTAVEIQTVDLSTANTVATATFTDSASFSASDIICISVNPTSDHQNVDLTIVLELEPF